MLFDFFRFTGAPKKLHFFVNGMNIVDVLSILPFYVALFITSSSIKSSDDVLESEDRGGQNLSRNF